MSSDVSILLVDRGDAVLDPLQTAFGDLGVVAARGHEDALSLMRQHRPAVALIDLGLAAKPNILHPGLTTLSAILEIEPSTKVLVAGFGHDPELALQAISRGAFDALEPTLAPELVRIIVERAVALSRLEREHRRRILAPGINPLPGVLGHSPPMIAVCRQVRRVAPTDASVVLTGESGTGKEVLARAMHAASNRHKRPFVAINCAAIPETLLESELFGYERGAFTGAVKQTSGRIEVASGGTLFLDEIGDLPLSLQGKLLRFLQERVIERIGGRREIAVDVRLVCATHRDLTSLIEAGSFREDLYYRLSEIALQLPPLRERDGDAILMAHHFMRQYGGAAAQPLKGFTSAALHALDAHPWPGNVRELQNRVKRAVIMTDELRIAPEDLGLPDVGEQPRDLDLRRRRDAVEVSVLRRALARCDGNNSLAARLIGVSRPTLYDLLRHHGLRA